MSFCRIMFFAVAAFASICSVSHTAPIEPLRSSLDYVISDTLLNSPIFYRTFRFGLSRRQVLNYAIPSVEYSMQFYGAMIIDQILNKFRESLPLVTQSSNARNYAYYISNAIASVLYTNQLDSYANGQTIANGISEKLTQIQQNTRMFYQAPVNSFQDQIGTGTNLNFHTGTFSTWGSQSGSAQSEASAQSGSALFGPAQYGPTQSESAQFNSAQSGSVQSESPQSGSAQFGSAQSGSAQFGSAQSESAQSGSAQSESAQSESAQSGSAESGSAQFGSPQFNSAPFGSAQSGSVQSGSAQFGSPQFNSAQFGSAQSESAQFGSAQTGLSEVESSNYQLQSPNPQIYPSPVSTMETVSNSNAFQNNLFALLSESNVIAAAFCNGQFPGCYRMIDSALIEFGTDVSSSAASEISNTFGSGTVDEACSMYAQTISSTINNVLQRFGKLQFADANIIYNKMISNIYSAPHPIHYSSQSDANTPQLQPSFSGEISQFNPSAEQPAFSAQQYNIPPVSTYNAENFDTINSGVPDNPASIHSDYFAPESYSQQSQFSDGAVPLNPANYPSFKEDTSQFNPSAEQPTFSSYQDSMPPVSTYNGGNFETYSGIPNSQVSMQSDYFPPESYSQQSQFFDGTQLNPVDYNTGPQASSMSQQSHIQDFYSSDAQPSNPPNPMYSDASSDISNYQQSNGNAGFSQNSQNFDTPLQFALPSDVSEPINEQPYFPPEPEYLALPQSSFPETPSTEYQSFLPINQPANSFTQMDTGRIQNPAVFISVNSETNRESAYQAPISSTQTDEAPATAFSSSSSANNVPTSRTQNMYQSTSTTNQQSQTYPMAASSTNEFIPSTGVPIEPGPVIISDVSPISTTKYSSMLSESSANTTSPTAPSSTSVSTEADSDVTASFFSSFMSTISSLATSTSEPDTDTTIFPFDITGITDYIMGQFTALLKTGTDNDDDTSDNSQTSQSTSGAFLSTTDSSKTSSSGDSDEDFEASDPAMVFASRIASSSSDFMKSPDFGLHKLCGRLNELSTVMDIPPVPAENCNELSLIDYLLHVIQAFSLSSSSD